MTIFYKAVDDLCDEKTKSLDRPLNWDDVRLIEDMLLMEWIEAKRYDDLIDHALDEYEIQDGVAFCASLSEALAQTGDRIRFERLFHGLTKTREAAFWRVWPKAQEGHIGAMKESSRHLASALEACAGLWHCYWVMKDDSGMRSTKEQMLRLQARERPKRKKA